MDYNHVSHTHCWFNPSKPCAIPDERHTQCCLCDMPAPGFEQCINPQMHVARLEYPCNGSCQLYVEEEDINAL